ncbi:hypothetical protein LHYA1_G007017 [Lachnellula hyalina]|uniref:Uncharacterized protein n=1 Tax=Lachnellula hyalina TaxID=1316788 RepID=A0A8H8TYT9_9HELO|nr:uncharacterized protein LHYA1_G007017 [Lachnellula hyalina]TVY24236.1 hypothetical protein LHYA1_G007017 [Lachnellula hyalina]
MERPKMKRPSIILSRLSRLRPLNHRHSTSSTSTTTQRLTKLLDRLPKPLHPYTQRLRSAPLSHILSFLILHEITAVVPLVGLAGMFHWAGWVPAGGFLGEREGAWVREGVVKFGRYFGRKGWFGFDGTEGMEGMEKLDGGVEGTGVRGEGERGGQGMRILIEVATAYAITKVLLPVRIVFSVWATPWFARVVMGRFGGLFGRGKGAIGVVKRSGAAGTRATGGGVIGKGNGKL